MSRVVVVSQPMFLPWIGLFEQVRLADVFIHYDDVQLPQGRSFVSRVQIKTSNGISWLTVPIDRVNSGRLINEVVLSRHEDWRTKHLKTIRHAYARTPFGDLVIELVAPVYGYETDRLSEFNINGIEQIARWLGLSPQFLRSSTMGASGSSTQRLVDLCKSVNCDTYVTGHGALNYLDYEKFEEANICVRYMNYQKVPYPQANGDFTPFVSIIDAIANCGDGARDLLRSTAVYWKDFDANRK